MRRALVLLVAAAPLAAQEPAVGVGTAVRTGAVFDGYYFGSGFAFRHVVEWTMPVTVFERVGSRLTVDLSSAYAHVSGATTSGLLQISGLTDTDVRASFAAVPGHLVLTVAGTLPTGKKAVSDSTIPLLSALATELLDFTTPSFGSGGGVTGGFAGAVRLGERWAGGLGASYRWHASYTPVAGTGQLEPGGEARVRLGAEGPLAGGGYFRGALVYTASGADTLGGGSRSITGDRILVYSALSFPAGRSSVSVYGYDMHRFRPRAYNSTNANAVQVPRGNVFALGARLERPLSPAVNLAPNFEFRHELAGPSTGSLELLGWLVRPGVDVRYHVSGAVALLLEGQTAFGRLADNGSSVSLVGPRVVALLEWSR
ncbi:MAG TPA: hypothetical protein VEU55_07555 [Gemmatimonadales bacterium]|nr:hypothetical protein [Gemmatimonadales bacterium]